MGHDCTDVLRTWDGGKVKEKYVEPENSVCLEAEEVEQAEKATMKM